MFYMMLVKDTVKIILSTAVAIQKALLFCFLDPSESILHQSGTRSIFFKK